MDPGPVTPSDVRAAAGQAVAALGALEGSSWERPAQDLRWSCRDTLDHVVDALLFYTAHLARRSPTRLAPLRGGDPAAAPGQLLDATTSAAAILAAVIETSARTARAFHPAGSADPGGFAAMACDEILVHAHDIAGGLDASFLPDPSLSARVLARLFPWAPGHDDPWATLLWANGRLALADRARLGPDWWWHCAPLSEWDGTVPRRPSVSTG